MPTASQWHRAKPANAAKGADWSKSFAQDLTFQKGNDAWPITSTTFILIYKEQANAEKGSEVLKFFDWAYKGGSKTATALDYAALPESVANQIRAAGKPTSKTVPVKRCTSKCMTRPASSLASLMGGLVAALITL